MEFHHIFDTEENKKTDWLYLTSNTPSHFVVVENAFVLRPNFKGNLTLRFSPEKRDVIAAKIRFVRTEKDGSIHWDMSLPGIKLEDPEFLLKCFALGYVPEELYAETSTGYVDIEAIESSDWAEIFSDRGSL